MTPTGETSRLAQIACWYYVQELSQDDIAARLGVSRSTVSRMLRTARERKIVRFEIHDPDGPGQAHQGPDRFAHMARGYPADRRVLEPPGEAPTPESLPEISGPGCT